MTAIRGELRDLYDDHAVCLDEMDLDGWCGFFTDDCTYRVISFEVGSGRQTEIARCR